MRIRHELLPLSVSYLVYGRKYTFIVVNAGSMILKGYMKKKSKKRLAELYDTGFKFDDEPEMYGELVDVKYGRTAPKNR